MLNEFEEWLDGEIQSQSLLSNGCSRSVHDKLVEVREKFRAIRPPANSMTVRMLPWICGNCGKHEVNSIRPYDSHGALIGKCDNCGSEWVT